MFYDYIYTTITNSYLLIFISIYTFTHVFYTCVIKPPLKLKDGVSYDFHFVFKNSEDNFITENSYLVIIFNMIALPIAALSSDHYWVYIGLSTLLLFILHLSDFFFAKRRNNRNPGLLTYIFFTFFYIPTSAVSIVLHLLGTGGS